MKDGVEYRVNWSIGRHHLLKLMYIAYSNIVIACKKHTVLNMPPIFILATVKIQTYSID